MFSLFEQSNRRVTLTSQEKSLRRDPSTRDTKWFDAGFGEQLNVLR